MQHTLITLYRPEAFAKAINRLNRKAKRIGAEPITYRLVEQKERERTITVSITGEDREFNETRECKEKVMTYSYEVSHLDVSVQGWELIARIHLSTESNDGTCYVDTFSPDTDPNQFAGANPGHCDHCGQNRRRIYGYIIRHADGRQLQVGSACLVELLGGDSASKLEFIAHLFHVLRDFDGDWEEGGSGRAGVNYILAKDAIAGSIARAARFGWEDNVKRMLPNGEYEIVKDGTHRITASQFRYKGKCDPIPGEQHYQQAEQVIESILDIPENPEDEFASEMQFALQQSVIPDYRAGLVAYAPRYWERHLQRQEEEVAKARSQHVGEIKKRDDYVLTVKRVARWESDFGEQCMHVFNDSHGNFLTWKTASYNELATGGTYKLKGTVKAHEVYRGCKQTVLTRCKVLEVINEPAEEA